MLSGVCKVCYRTADRVCCDYYCNRCINKLYNNSMHLLKCNVCQEHLSLITLYDVLDSSVYRKYLTNIIVMIRRSIKGNYVDLQDMSILVKSIREYQCVNSSIESLKGISNTKYIDGHIIKLIDMKTEIYHTIEHVIKNYDIHDLHLYLSATGHDLHMLLLPLIDIDIPSSPISDSVMKQFSDMKKKINQYPDTYMRVAVLYNYARNMFQDHLEVSVSLMSLIDSEYPEYNNCSVIIQLELERLIGPFNSVVDLILSSDESNIISNILKSIDVVLTISNLIG